MKSTTAATMALLMHLGTAADLPEHQPNIIELAEQAADWDDLPDDLYNIVDEDADFDAAVDDLEAIWLKTTNQIEYYEGLAISFNNFVGEWEDRDGELVSGDAGNKFNGGTRINIDIRGTWSGAAKPGTAWFNGRNEVNLRDQDSAVDNFTKLIDGHLLVENSNNQKYILQRPQ